MEKSQACVSRKYRWHMTIEAEWEDLRRTNSPCDIFTQFSHYFQLNLDETSFTCNEAEIKVLGSKYKPLHEKNSVTQGFQLKPFGLGVQQV